MNSNEYFYKHFKGINTNFYDKLYINTSSLLKLNV
jgi:hypothetical protein